MNKIQNPPQINFVINPMVTIPKEEYDNLLRKAKALDAAVRLVLDSQATLRKELRGIGL